MRTPSASLLRGGGKGVQHLLIDISAIQGQQIFLHQRADLLPGAGPLLL